MWHATQVHGPQVVVGVEGVDIMEVFDLVVAVFLSRNTCIRMTNRLQRNQTARLAGTCSSMAPGHRDACLTLMLGHPTSLAMRTHCHLNVQPMMIVRDTHPILMLALDPHYLPPVCLPHYSSNLATGVDLVVSSVYLYPHLAMVFKPKPDHMVRPS